MSSVQLLDEAAAERQRVDLINRLVKEALAADFDGGWGRAANPGAWVACRRGGAGTCSRCAVCTRQAGIWRHRHARRQVGRLC